MWINMHAHSQHFGHYLVVVNVWVNVRCRNRWMLTCWDTKNLWKSSGTNRAQHFQLACLELMNSNFTNAFASARDVARSLTGNKCLNTSPLSRVYRTLQLSTIFVYSLYSDLYQDKHFFFFFTTNNSEWHAKQMSKTSGLGNNKCWRACKSPRE